MYIIRIVILLFCLIHVRFGEPNLFNRSGDIYIYLFHKSILCLYNRKLIAKFFATGTNRSIHWGTFTCLNYPNVEKGPVGLEGEPNVQVLVP